MGKGYRTGRLGEEIRKITGELLVREIKDPRLKKHMISISGVDVTGDGSIATIYVTVLSISGAEELSKEEKDEVLDALKSAKGLIKREIGKQVKLRHTPELLFKFDSSLEYGMHIDKLIEDIGTKKDD